jgi:hypothetical protein
MGDIDEYIFNDWHTDGTPYYNESKTDNVKFTKVFSIGDYAGEHGANENLVIYSDGTLATKNIKLEGEVSWTSASSPSKNVYRRGTATKPADGTLYKDFADKDPENSEPVWHKEWNDKADTHYCHTDDGGATWQGPFLVTGKSIVSTDTFYGVGEIGLTD